VIIGKLIPAGTGLVRYRNVNIEVEGQEEAAQSDLEAEVELVSG
jgi:DNA-directed RNA polymerase subunit beta'